MERSKSKAKPIWKPQHFYVRYHYRRMRWMVTDNCGHYIGLDGEITDKHKFHKTSAIAAEYLIMYQRKPIGRKNQEHIVAYAKVEQGHVMAEQAERENNK